MDTWTHGHMGTWTHGHMYTWAHGHMDTWAGKQTGRQEDRLTGRMHTWQAGRQAGEKSRQGQAGSHISDAEVSTRIEARLGDSGHVIGPGGLNFTVKEATAGVLPASCLAQSSHPLPTLYAASHVETEPKSRRAVT